MSKQGRRDPELERRWRERIEAWASSGLSARAFCREHGLNDQSFYSWRRTVRQRDAAGAVQAVPDPPPSFIPITVTERATRSTESAIEIVLPSGPTVRVLGAPPRDAIASVLGALTSC